jgi:hypothetical protein
MNQLSRISPVTDAEAARLVQPGTLADLAAEITATSLPSGPGRHGHASAAGDRPRPGRRRRGWLIGAPLAAGLAAAVFALVSPGSPGHHAGHPVARNRPTVATNQHPATQAQVLSFVRHGGYIIVKVRNPLADPARYNAEFAAHHLRIRLNLVSASPSLVGTLVYTGQSQGSSPITPITARGRCHTGGGGSACPVGVRVPVDFRGSAVLTFGRAARPGEKYETTASAFAPGEVMHGMSIQGQTVAQVLAALRARHVTVPLFNTIRKNLGVNVHHVPGNWYVYDATPWAPGQVMLSVGKTRTQPVPKAPVQNGNQAQPSPTPAG